MSESESYAYALGRKVGTLQAPFRERELAFGSSRLDGQTIQDSDFKHCTFVNISFLKTIIRKGVFEDCVFVGCYFRRAELKDSSFVGCRFIDCHFGHVAIQSSQFKYSSFRGCQIAFAELEHSLPQEPNLREELARNLSLESSRLGRSSDARQYRIAEIQAREADLRAAVACKSQWYKDHFDGFARYRAVIKLIGSWLNRWLFGYYGEQPWTLFKNVLMFSLLLFPFCFYLARDGLTKRVSGSVDFLDLIYFSIDNILPAGIGSGIEAVSLMARILASAETVFGLLALALFASHIVRWSLHR